MEDVMKDEIIPAFVNRVKETTGEEVRFVTSFAGSGTITNQLMFGAPAHVAILAANPRDLNRLTIGRRLRGRMADFLAGYGGIQRLVAVRHALVE